MRWRGVLRKAGIVSDGRNVTFSGEIRGSQVPGVAPPGGRVFVDKSVSATGTGLTWSSAYKTIAEAITAMNAAIDWSGSPWADATEIHVAPGSYAENLTSLPHGCSLIGHGDCWDADGERGVRIKPASGSPVDVSAFVNGAIINVGFESADTSRVFDAAILNNVQMYHCRFAGAPETTTATAGVYTNDSVMLTVRDCRFEYLDCGLDFVYADGGDSFTRGLIEGNYITYCSEAGIRVSANLVAPASNIIGNIISGGGTTLAIGVDINMATNTVGIYGNIITATDGIEGDTTGPYVGGNYCNGVLE